MKNAEVSIWSGFLHQLDLRVLLVHLPMKIILQVHLLKAALADHAVAALAVVRVRVWFLDY